MEKMLQIQNVYTPLLDLMAKEYDKALTIEELNDIVIMSDKVKRSYKELSMIVDYCNNNDIVVNSLKIENDGVFVLCTQEPLFSYTVWVHAYSATIENVNHFVSVPKDELYKYY